MNRIRLPRRDLEGERLARHLPHGKIIGRSNGRLRIEGVEDAMDDLMAEVNAAYYRGVLDPQKVDVVVAPAKSKRKPIKNVPAICS